MSHRAFYRASVGVPGYGSGRPSGESSQQALLEGRYETGLALLEQEAKESPNDGKIRATIARERLQAANKLSIAGSRHARKDDSTMLNRISDVPWP